MDLEFLVSDRDGYRELRQLISRKGSLMARWRLEEIPLQEEREPLADQYEIRARVIVDDGAIKFKIVLEGRVQATGEFRALERRQHLQSRRA